MEFCIVRFLSYLDVRSDDFKARFIEVSELGRKMLPKCICTLLEFVYQLYWNQQKHFNWTLFVLFTFRFFFSFLACIGNKHIFSQCQWNISIGTFYAIVCWPFFVAFLNDSIFLFATMRNTLREIKLHHNH